MTLLIVLALLVGYGVVAGVFYILGKELLSLEDGDLVPFAGFWVIAMWPALGIAGARWLLSNRKPKPKPEPVEQVCPKCKARSEYR